MFRKTVDKYSLGSLLGEGTFAKVRECFHVETSQRFAMKILDLSKVRTQNLTDLVKREITIMKKLSHPNVIKLQEVLSSKSKLYIVLELADGELFNLISKQHHFEESVAANYFHQLVSGIQYLHSQHISHRDIKPENILLTNNVIKITDFGLARILESSESAQTACGTLHYVAPDVIRSRESGGYCPFLSDIWSCGVVLYVMCAGRLPFENRQSTSLLFNQICSCDYEMPRHFSTLLQDLIRKILVADPQKRLTIDQILNHPWLKHHAESIHIPEAQGFASDTAQYSRAGVAASITGEISIDLQDGDYNLDGDDVLLLTSNNTHNEPTILPNKKLLALTTAFSLAEATQKVTSLLTNYGATVEPRDNNRLKVTVHDTVFLVQAFDNSSSKRLVMLTKRTGSTLEFWSFIRRIKEDLVTVLK
ncbi:hypothetical protein RCL1_003418 [Eukaryota sp. TZLM3-RCL]